MYYRQLTSPLGKLLLTSDGAGADRAVHDPAGRGIRPAAGGAMDAGRRAVPRGLRAA